MPTPFHRWAIPVCLFSSWVYMNTRYHWTQVLVGLGMLRLAMFRVDSILQGVVISIGGLSLLVVSDLVTGKDGHAENRSMGDALMVVAATIFGIGAYSDEYTMNQAAHSWHSECNRRVLCETLTALRGAYVVQHFRDLVCMKSQVIGQLGMWGTLVSGVQAFVLERDLVADAPWHSETSALDPSFALQHTDPSVVGLWLVYTLCKPPLACEGWVKLTRRQPCSCSSLWRRGSSARHHLPTLTCPYLPATFTDLFLVCRLTHLWTWVLTADGQVSFSLYVPVNVPGPWCASNATFFSTALFPILAILSCVRCGHAGPRHILLACYTYVVSMRPYRRHRN